QTLKSTLDVYKDILNSYAPEKIRIFGTSSGGGQALSLCTFIKKEYPDVPMPGKLVLQSPGVQVPPSREQKQKMARLEKYDVMIPPAFFEKIAPVLADENDKYLLSPILNDMTGFPQTDVFYGTHEVMYAFAEDMKKAYEKYGVKLNVHIGKGMMHCWGAMEFVPEAKAVRREYFKALK
ncbi:MAG: alpha/beta hydrolase, partial [Muribaculaceae bacterium]|nr:alpha/beta hydrolase [Muribaculaceae bacterium]